MEYLSQIGGLFAILVFLHFAGDFIFQKQEEAFKKSSCWKTRFWHCFDYITPFIFLLIWKDKSLSDLNATLALVVLFASHFIIDSYYFTYLWAQSFRQIPSIHDALTKEKAREAFKNEFKTPVNAILFFFIPIASSANLSLFCNKLPILSFIIFPFLFLHM